MIRVNRHVDFASREIWLVVRLRMTRVLQWEYWAVYFAWRLAYMATGLLPTLVLRCVWQDRVVIPLRRWGSQLPSGWVADG